MEYENCPYLDRIQALERDVKQAIQLMQHKQQY